MSVFIALMRESRGVLLVRSVQFIASFFAVFCLFGPEIGREIAQCIPCSFNYKPSSPKRQQRTNPQCLFCPAFATLGHV